MSDTLVDAVASPAPPRLAWLDPLVAGAIYAAGVALIAGWPKSFAGADDRIAIAGPAAAIVVASGCAMASLPRTAWAAPVFFAVSVLAATLPTLQPMNDSLRWSLATLALVTLGAAVVGLIDIIALGLVKRRGAGGVASLVLLGMSLATGALAMMTGSIRIAEKTWPLAIAVALSAIVGIFLPTRRASVGVAAFAVAVIMAQLAAAHLWSDLALWQAACVFVAPILAAIVTRVPIVARRRPWLRAAIVLLIAATPATVACGIAGAEAYRTSQSDGASEFGY